MILTDHHAPTTAAPSESADEDEVLPISRFDELLGTAPRRVLTAEQRARFETSTAEMFEAMGMDLATPGTAETPRRFVQALFDATAGYDGDPKLVTVFPTECHSDS